MYCGLMLLGVQGLEWSLVTLDSVESGAWRGVFGKRECGDACKEREREDDYVALDCQECVWGSLHNPGQCMHGRVSGEGCEEVL